MGLPTHSVIEFLEHSFKGLPNEEFINNKPIRSEDTTDKEWEMILIDYFRFNGYEMLLRCINIQNGVHNSQPSFTEEV